jgi:hypothetical protein
VKGKRLFWAAIIVVELVLVYLLWKPTQARFGKQAHRTPPVVTQPAENETAANLPPKAPAVAEAPRAGSTPLPPMRSPAAPAHRPAPPTTTAKAAPHPIPPAAKSSVLAAVPHKPSPIPHVEPRTRRNPPAINAGLVSRAPVPLKKLAPPPLSPLESFWCQMSTIDSNCNCKGNDERAATAPNAPLQ